MDLPLPPPPSVGRLGPEAPARDFFMFPRCFCCFLCFPGLFVVCLSPFFVFPSLFAVQCFVFRFPEELLGVCTYFVFARFPVVFCRWIFRVSEVFCCFVFRCFRFAEPFRRLIFMLSFSRGWLLLYMCDGKKPGNMKNIKIQTAKKCGKNKNSGGKRVHDHSWTLLGVIWTTPLVTNRVKLKSTMVNKNVEQWP